MTSPMCLPERDPRPRRTTCGPVRTRVRSGAGPRAALIVVIIFVTAALPLAFIASGMSPTAAVSTAGAIVAFAIGATHQILGLIPAPGRRAVTRPVTA
ncbi:hypothetical protein [Actinoplanes sp. NPDC049681]|uniref:hypothetical protein n=1 Tax=Actinoplanes sp. NPDC049681 TaxID=3363905 RepID=UPI0037B625B0